MMILLRRIKQIACSVALLPLALVTTAQDTTVWKITGNGNTDTSHYLGTADSAALIFRANHLPAMRILGNGKVGVGDSLNREDYLLAVKGSLLTEKLTVKAYGDWPDYVFEKGYPLPPLREVEAYYLLHHHLPGIPPAAALEGNGLDTGELTAKLLKKVEELTVYIFERKKQLVALREKIVNLEKND